MSEEDHAQDIEDLTTEINRLKAELAQKQRSFVISCSNLAEMNDRLAKVIAALNSAMVLTDRLMAEMRDGGATPSGVAVAAKATFDQAMRKLLFNEGGASEPVKPKTIIEQ